MAVFDPQELCGAAALTAPACPWCLMGGVSVLHEGQYPQGCSETFSEAYLCSDKQRKVV